MKTALHARPIHSNHPSDVRSPRRVQSVPGTITNGLSNTTKVSQGPDSMESSLANLPPADHPSSIENAMPGSTNHTSGVERTKNTYLQYPKRGKGTRLRASTTTDEVAATANKRSPPKLRRKASTPQTGLPWEPPQTFTLRKGLST